MKRFVKILTAFMTLWWIALLLTGMYIVSREMIHYLREIS